MTKKILGAIILIAIFVPFLIIGELPFTILMSVLSIFGLYELLKVRETKKKFPLVLKIFAYLLTCYFCLYNTNSIEFINKFDYRVMAGIIFLFISPIVFINNNEEYNINDALFLIGSVLFIGLSFNLIIITRNYDITYIIYLLLITTITDTFALFTGMLIGKHKLCPKISPKKTIEGLIGGTIMGTFVATIFYNTIISSTVPLVTVIMLTFVLCLVGQLGDLVFSSIKRYYDVKDFSNLIPGHGGILDRFDSLIFVVLAFTILIEIL
ncbi:MAG: phosphatidate cytidylyltransferase [Bacilli bacterium]|nr:phosphatidate cytidylyltransferase [Bacilli bacterium]